MRREESVSAPPPPPPRATLALLASHALAQWGWRSWEFAVALLLSRLFPGAMPPSHGSCCLRKTGTSEMALVQMSGSVALARLFTPLLPGAGTFAPVAAYGLADDAFRVASGGAVGRHLDAAQSRVRSATRLYALQHACVAASALAALLAAAAPPGPGRSAIAVLVVAFGATAGIGATGSSLAVERHFVKALCGEDTQAMALLNSRMRAVDLACLFLAPILAGALLQGGGLAVAIGALMAYNAAAFWPERALLRAAAAAAPALEACAPAAEPPVGPGWREAVRVYARQPVLPAALSLALLYFTVLSLGFMMTSYLHARGLPDVAIAIVRAAGAASGLSATAAFPRLARSMQMPTLTAAGVALQLTWLLIGVIPQLAVPADKGQSAPLLRLLMAGLALSRFGLWTADLAVSQMLQDDVSAAELGTVNGVQGSVCAGFEMASFVAGLALRTPRDFAALLAMSCAAVALSCAVLARFAMQRRGAKAYAPMQQPASIVNVLDPPRELVPLAQERAPLLLAQDDATAS